MKVHLSVKQAGFTLLELVAVMIIAAILAASAASKLFSNAPLELMATRDKVVAAFSSAQQLAMAQAVPVRFSTSSGRIDIRQDTNTDDVFSASESVSIDGVQYPLPISTSQTMSAESFDFLNRLGRTSAGTITLSQDTSSVTISITTSGFIQ